MTPADEQAFRQQVQAFLAAAPLPEMTGKEEFRQQCLRELRAARKAGLLTEGSLDPRELARKTGTLARFHDPTQLLQAESQALTGLAEEVRQGGYKNLAWLLEQRPQQGPTLLVAAVRYFFRRQVETESELFQGLTFSRLEGLTQAQEIGFASLAETLDRHGQRLESLLSDVQFVVVETHGDVLDLKAEVQRQGTQLQDLGQAVLDALEQNRLQAREVRPRDSLSIRGEDERRLVKALVARYRSLPAEEQQQTPALLNALGKLQVAAGDLQEAQENFQTVARVVDNPAARAEAHFNAYQAALEQRQWPAALDILHSAVRLDPQRFAPFPFEKYEPEAILGAGGFGVAFRCRHRNSGSRVVVKSLHVDGLERDVTEVFREARVLEELDHAAIIRLRDCDYAVGQSRPFLVMEYFEGRTLAEQVERDGPLRPEDLLMVIQPVAQGLRAAHSRGVLHRDVKPANLLVRKEGAAWRVKLIDFGLALTRAVLLDTVATPGRSAHTAVSQSVAGTVDYAAPEQIGRLPNVDVGPPADVYGFGKTCCFALFRTTQPLPRHFRSLPPSLAHLLEWSLEETPDNRPKDFNVVLDWLRRSVDEAIPTVQAAQEENIATALPVKQPTTEDVPLVEAVNPAPAAKKSSKKLRPVRRAPVMFRLLYSGDWFIFDSRIEVFLDGCNIGKGSAIHGINLTLGTNVGNHSLELRVNFRSKCYLLQFMKEGDYEVRLYYDRMWSTFSDRIDVVYLS